MEAKEMEGTKVQTENPDPVAVAIKTMMQWSKKGLWISTLLFITMTALIISLRITFLIFCVIVDYFRMDEVKGTVFALCMVFGMWPLMFVSLMLPMLGVLQFVYGMPVKTYLQAVTPRCVCYANLAAMRARIWTPLCDGSALGAFLSISIGLSMAFVLTVLIAIGGGNPNHMWLMYGWIKCFGIPYLVLFLLLVVLTLVEDIPDIYGALKVSLDEDHKRAVKRIDDTMETARRWLVRAWQLWNHLKQWKEAAKSAVTWVKESIEERWEHTVNLTESTTINDRDVVVLVDFSGTNMDMHNDNAGVCLHKAYGIVPNRARAVLETVLHTLSEDVQCNSLAMYSYGETRGNPAYCSMIHPEDKFELQYAYKHGVTHNNEIPIKHLMGCYDRMQQMLIEGDNAYDACDNLTVPSVLVKIAKKHGKYGKPLLVFVITPDTDACPYTREMDRYSDRVNYITIPTTTMKGTPSSTVESKYIPIDYLNTPVRKWQGQLMGKIDEHVLSITTPGEKKTV